MKKIILLFCLLTSGLVSAKDILVCSFAEEDMKYTLKAELLKNEDWENGVMVIQHDMFFKVLSLREEGEVKKVQITVYTEENEDLRKVPLSRVEELKASIYKFHIGANAAKDVEIEVPGLFVVQMSQGRIKNDEYVDNVFCATACTKLVVIKKRDSRKLEDYCPVKKTKEGIYPPSFF